MKKYILGYIPAILFTLFYLIAGVLTGVSLSMSMILIWLACFWIAAVLLHKGLFWGGAFGLFPALHMIYMSTQYTGQVINIELPLGIALLLFYIILGVYLWKKRDAQTNTAFKESLPLLLKILLTGAVVIATPFVAVISGMILISEGVHQAFAYIGMLVLPSLLPLIWLKKRKKYLIVWGCAAAVYFIALGVNYGLKKYDESITVNTAPNINVHEYLPFEEDSKIVKIDSKTLKLTEDLPRIDGAAAFFPVYSAFIHAVYPETTELYDGVFEYNNTPGGYQLLAEKGIDLFLGVYPSEEQKAYAEECGTTFVYTPVGTEAFVFFVHKDNPIDSLTTEQIKGIYSGEITNWKQLGGKNEEIAAFQRNEGSGSQSMLERFMGETPIMEAPTELKNDLMSGIIEQVSNYRSKSNSIGFSFRYYVEGIIKNSDIKMLAVDGVLPTAENIRNGSYSVVTPIYAVTYAENDNENVDQLLQWILSEEGQYIIEETGYVGVSGTGQAEDAGASAESESPSSETGGGAPPAEQFDTAEEAAEHIIAVKAAGVEETVAANHVGLYDKEYIYALKEPPLPEYEQISIMITLQGTAILYGTDDLWDGTTFFWQQGAESDEKIKNLTERYGLERYQDTKFFFGTSMSDICILWWEHGDQFEFTYPSEVGVAPEDIIAHLEVEKYDV